MDSKEFLGAVSPDQQLAVKHRAIRFPSIRELWPTSIDKQIESGETEYGLSRRRRRVGYDPDAIHCYARHTVNG